MANAMIALRVYRINSGPDTGIPTASVPTVDFPFAGITVRAINAPGTTGIATPTGQVVYSDVTVIATGTTYSVAETPSQIQALS
jgi:hypothetical protein